VHYKRKYLLNRRWPDLMKLLVADPRFFRSEIRQIFINRRTRIERIETGTGVSYVHTSKHEIDKTGRGVKVQSPLDAAEFDLVAKADGDKTLYKTRFAATFDAAHWVIDFLHDAEGTTYLAFAEADLPAKLDPAKLKVPKFLSPFITYEIPDGKLRDFANANFTDPKQADKLLRKFLD
jgi:hypothetical protein